MYNYKGIYETKSKSKIRFSMNMQNERHFKKFLNDLGAVLIKAEETKIVYKEKKQKNMKEYYSKNKGKII